MAVSVWYLVHLFSDKLEGVDTSDDNSSAVGGFARVTLPGVGEGTEKENLPWIFLVVSFIAFLAIGAWPVWLARTAGVIAIVIGALAALSIAIGSIVLFEQNRPPPELLRLLRGLISGFGAFALFCFALVVSLHRLDIAAAFALATALALLTQGATLALARGERAAVAVPEI